VAAPPRPARTRSSDAVHDGEAASVVVVVVVEVVGGAGVATQATTPLAGAVDVVVVGVELLVQPAGSATVTPSNDRRTQICFISIVDAPACLFLAPR